MAAARPSGSVASSRATLAQAPQPGHLGGSGPRPDARRPGAGARPPRPARPAGPRRHQDRHSSLPCRHDMVYCGQRPGLPERPKGASPRLGRAMSESTSKGSARDQADPGEGQRQGQGQLRPPKDSVNGKVSVVGTSTADRSATRSARAATAPRVSASPAGLAAVRLPLPRRRRPLARRRQRGSEAERVRKRDSVIHT